MQKLIWISLLLCTNFIWAQVKIGDNINEIDIASILELESTSKAFVPTRMTSQQMNALAPLNGALVYNTDVKCVFIYDGLDWKSLCNSEIMVVTSSTPPTTNGIGDFWVNDTDNKVYVWDGDEWILIVKNPRSGSGAPDTLTITDAISGDIYVDKSTGDLYTYDGVDWIDQTINVTNGLNEATNNTFELGGALIKPTEIGTDDTNTIAITGIEEITDNTNAILTIEPTTGVLRQTSISSVVQQEEAIIIANASQTQFTPPLTITSSKKLNVYRNGVKIGFMVLDDSTIELEADVVCYQNDEIRIVQFY